MLLFSVLLTFLKDFLRAYFLSEICEERLLALVLPAVVEGPGGRGMRNNRDLPGGFRTPAVGSSKQK